MENLNVPFVFTAFSLRLLDFLELEQNFIKIKMCVGVGIDNFFGEENLEGRQSLFRGTEERTRENSL